MYNSGATVLPVEAVPATSNLLPQVLNTLSNYPQAQLSQNFVLKL
jgi:hypothetical protein